MVDKEMLAAMSEMLDQKLDEKLEQLKNNVIPRLDKVEADIKYVKEEQLENNVIPRLGKLEAELENNVIPRLDKLEADMKYVRVVSLENDVIPRLKNIEGHYVAVSERYMKKAEQFDAMSDDIKVLQSVVVNHSEKLNRICV